MDKETGVDKKISSRRIFLTLEEWFKIKSRYLNGDVIAVIARDYQMSRKTIDSRARRENWPKHGSRKEALENKIDEETEVELIDGYKVAVDQANEKHLEGVNLIQDVAVYVLNFVMELLKDKYAEYEKLKAEGKHIQCDFSIYNEVRTIGIAGNLLQRAIGSVGGEREILGIKDKPYLVDPNAEKEKAEMSKIFKLGVDKVMQLVDEDKERIKAEVRAEIMAEMELGSHSLQS